MIVRNYNNKNYIELTEDKLILYRIWGKRTFKRNKIRAAYIDNNNYINILYGSRVIRYGAIKVKIEDEGILEEIIEKINVEKIVFCPDKNEAMASIIIMGLIWGGNMATNPSCSLFARLLGAVMFTLSIISFFYHFYYRRVLIYDNKNKTIKLTRTATKFKIFIPGSETYKLIEHKTMPAICTFKVQKYNNVVIQTDIRYPKYYREELKELYKVSNN